MDLKQTTPHNQKDKMETNLTDAAMGISQQMQTMVSLVGVFVVMSIMIIIILTAFNSFGGKRERPENYEEEDESTEEERKGYWADEEWTDSQYDSK